MIPFFGSTSHSLQPYSSGPQEGQGKDGVVEAAERVYDEIAKMQKVFVQHG